MIKLNPTPLARRHLKDQPRQLRNQLLGLSDDPKTWQSDHLRRAFEIVAKHRSTEIAKRIVLESVSAAGAAVKEASFRSLESSRQSALTDFNANCRIIGNCTKSTRLRKEVRVELDKAARSVFVQKACNAEPIEHAIDLEHVQSFFYLFKGIVERWQEDKNAQAIFKHIVSIKRDRTHEAEFPLQNRSDIVHNAAFSVRERAPKIALDYEALATNARLACERSLRLVIAEKSENLTAHDIFASLNAASKSVILTQNLQEKPAILDIYLAAIGRIWTDEGLGLGRGNYRANTAYMSPFHEFAERVLMFEWDPASRFFTPLTSNELKSAKKAYDGIPRALRSNISAAPFKGTRVITDHLLRSHLKRSKK
jgi:hypothetical protein